MTHTTKVMRWCRTSNRLHLLSNSMPRILVSADTLTLEILTREVHVVRTIHHAEDRQAEAKLARGARSQTTKGREMGQYLQVLSSHLAKCSCLHHSFTEVGSPCRLLTRWMRRVSQEFRIRRSEHTAGELQSKAPRRIQYHRQKPPGMLTMTTAASPTGLMRAITSTVRVTSSQLTGNRHLPLPRGAHTIVPAAKKLETRRGRRRIDLGGVVQSHASPTDLFSVPRRVGLQGLDDLGPTEHVSTIRLLHGPKKCPRFGSVGLSPDPSLKSRTDPRRNLQ